MQIEERLQRLEDDRMIRDLKATYLRACDLKDAEALRETLLPVGARIAYDGFPTFDNREEFVAVYTKMACVPGVFDMHHGANGVISFRTDAKATGKWSLYFHNINLEAKTLTQMGVEYDDVYVKEGGRWWISETRSQRTSCLIHTVENGQSKIAVMGKAPAAFGEAGG